MTSPRVVPPPPSSSHPSATFVRNARFRGSLNLFLPVEVAEERYYIFLKQFRCRLRTSRFSYFRKRSRIVAIKFDEHLDQRTMGEISREYFLRKLSRLGGLIDSN